MCVREGAGLEDFDRGHYRIRQAPQAGARLSVIRGEGIGSEGGDDFDRAGPRPHHPDGRLYYGVEGSRKKSLELLSPAHLQPWGRSKRWWCWLSPGWQRLDTKQTLPQFWGN